MAASEAITMSRRAAPDVVAAVKEIVAAVRRGGDAAVREHALRFDGWAPEALRLTDDEVAACVAQVPAQARADLEFACEQVRTFARAQRGSLRDLEIETLPGVRLGHRHVPVGAVGAYVPGGRFPMVASSFMTVLVARAAGVEDVTACAPPRAGRGIPAPMLHAIATSGADRVLCLGGVQ